MYSYLPFQKNKQQQQKPKNSLIANANQCKRKNMAN